MNTLSDNFQHIINRYIHQIEFRNVVNELNEIVDVWCDEQLTFRYCKARHMPIFNKCKHEFKCLNDYEEHLFIDSKPKDILDIINDTYDIFK